LKGVSGCVATRGRPFRAPRSFRKIVLIPLAGILVISGPNSSDPEGYDGGFRDVGCADGAEAPNESAQRGMPVAPISTTPGTSASVQDGRV
jgi:hypothetical protein